MAVIAKISSDDASGRTMGLENRSWAIWWPLCIAIWLIAVAVAAVRDAGARKRGKK